MKSTGVIQVVIVLLLVASAASCEVAKEYSNRVFKPTVIEKKQESTALKFMQFDSGNASDSVDLKDFAKEETREIKEVEKPEIARDTMKTDVAVVESKPVLKEQPIDGTRRSSTRNKKVRQ